MALTTWYTRARGVFLPPGHVRWVSQTQLVFTQLYNCKVGSEHRSLVATSSAVNMLEEAALTESGGGTISSGNRLGGNT